jgi:ABC-type branched-subunit amino acid transport system ATPase component/ABC-type branched-subunit amino acid transport system permease subunit
MPRSAADRVRGTAGILVENAHWVAGAAFIVGWLLWIRGDVGGSWSSASRQNVYLANVLLLYMLVAMGLNLISGFVGAASIGHIGLFSIGAYTEAILTVDHGWNPWLAIVAGGLIAMVAVLPVGFILLRLSGWYFSVVTLLLVIVVADLTIQQKELTGGGAGIFGLVMPSIGSHQLSQGDYLYLILTINTVVFLMLRYLTQRSRWGKAFVAVRDAEPAARAVGIHPFMVRESALAMSGFLAGVAGGLFAPLPGLITPDSFPILDSIFFLLVVLAGGMGTISGPVIGTTVLYMIPQVLSRQESLKEYSYLVYGLLLLALVVALPEGIVGGAKRVWAQTVARWTQTWRPSSRHMEPTIAEIEEVPHPADLSIDRDAAQVLAYLRAADTSAVSAPAIEVTGVTKAFGDNVALQRVSVSIERSHVHAIIGPNGSGKTTLLNIISGFYSQDAGKVLAFGRAVPRGRASSSIRYGIARTFQSPQILAGLSVAENVMLGSHSRGRVTLLDGMVPLPHVWRERKRFRERALACIELVGLNREVADVPCGLLPFAHQRLVEIARALAGEPKVLLLDEPASGLHPDEVRAFAALIRQLQAAGLTIVLIEHNFELVAELATTITVLDAGELLAEGDVTSIRENPSVREAYLGI